MQPSRRAFLLAGRAPASAWGRFCQRLARSVRGRFEDETPDARACGRARLMPARMADVHHAMALCTEADVRFVLDGIAPAPDAPCLIIDPSALSALDRESDGSVYAEAGVHVGIIRDMLPGACAGGQADWTLGRWLACTSHFPPACFGGSGLDSIDVLLADGTMETFGPFGVDTRRAALSLKTSRLVSDLFTWVSQPAVAQWRALPAWPATYRIDALLADTPNLAHVLLGSGARLAWPQRLRLVAPTPPAPPATPPAAGFDAAILNQAADLDRRIRQRFDPDRLFA